MSEQTDNISSLLKPFGLSVDEINIYLVLLKKGTLTALQISRKIRMGRTKVYRILDMMIEKELVVQQYDETGMKFTASNPAQLEMMVAKQEGQLQGLKAVLPQVVSTLERHMSTGQPGSKVLYYRGQRGLSQVNFNLLNAREEFLSLEVENAGAYLPSAEAETLRRQILERGLLNRMITNRKHIHLHTQVSGMVKNLWQVRFIDPSVFQVRADTFIYNDVYALCHYLENNDVFCLEMYNRHLEAMQKQLFEVLWQQAKPLTILNDQGEAVLK